MAKGRIIEIQGPVIDVRFKKGELPKIKEALIVDVKGEKRVMEVSAHVGNEVVRCIMLDRAENMRLDMEVISDGHGVFTSSFTAGSSCVRNMFFLSNRRLRSGHCRYDHYKE